MSDSCGQVDVASAAQHAAMSGAAQQMQKGGHNANVPNMMPSSHLNNFITASNRMHLGGDIVQEQEAAAALASYSINNTWGGMKQAAPVQQVPQQAIGGPIGQQPQQPQQQHPQFYQQMMRQQSMVQQQQQQQHQQQQVMMNIMQQQQFRQQQMMMQQQQLNQQMMMQQQQTQQSISAPLLQQQSIIAPTTVQSEPTVASSTSIFALLREQQTNLDHEALESLDQDTTQGLDTEIEEPHGDISQYLSDNYQHMYHAGGQLNSNMAEMLDPGSAIFDKMAQSSNEKLSQSKFVRFIQQYQAGEIDFVGDEVINRDYSSLLNEDGEQQGDHLSKMNEELWNGLIEDAQDEENDYDGEGDIWQQDWIENWKNNIELPEGYEELQAKIQDNIRKYTTPITPTTFQEAVDLFDRGHIYEAAEGFNNVTIQEPTHSQAWMYLGKCYAQLDRDATAITCLQKCISLDPYNLPALLALGVSLSNSHERHTAVSHLVTWVTSHPDLAGHVDTSEVEQIIAKMEEHGPVGGLPEELNTSTIKMFSQAAQVSANDVELQTVLGLLHLINKDFPASIAAFTDALRIEPNNAELWNRLGAVIANSGRDDQAPKFYQQALSLRPNYLRAKANCAQAYFNLQQFDLAYPIFLDIIFNSPDAAAENQTAPHPHLWPMLRQCFDFCGLPELSDAVMTRNLKILTATMEEHGMNRDGSVKEGFKQPVCFDFE